VSPVDVPGVLVGDAITRAVGEELRRAREARGMSRLQFVALLPSGICERSVLAYEHGLRQLTLLRLAELSWALDVDPTTVFARGLQRARILVDHLPLAVDLRALLDDQCPKFRPLAPWARNSLNDHPDGVAEVEPAVVRHLASFIGCDHSELADHLARFIPDNSSAGEQEAAKSPV
jgi:transcriptional regulator with XRE-family HTH domain